MSALEHRPGAGRARVLVQGLDHPEGVAWDPTMGVVYAGGEAGQIYRVDPADPRPDEVGRAPGFVLGLCADGRGRLAVCVSEGHPSLCAGPAERVTPLVTEAGGEPLLFPNSPAFGPDGTLYFSDSGGWESATGRIVRVAPDGATDVLSRRLDRFPNGLAVSPDGRWLWVAESNGPSVNRIDLHDPARVEIVVRLHGHVPDGLAFTADGGVLISNYRPDRIYHLDPAGHLEVVAQDPHGTLLAAPTNVCFVGERQDRVVSANLGRWHLTLLDLGLVGAPLHRPERWALDALEPPGGASAAPGDR